MRNTTLAAILMAASASMTLAWAQGNAPFIRPNPADTAPASALDDMPNKVISNGIVSAKVYLPDEFGFYRSTRFDHAGMITHITYKGQDYGKYWFVKTSPDVKNFTYDEDGLVAHPSDVAAGPVEEFGENGFDAAGPGGRFLKIGVGILKRDNDKYDRFHTYPILDRGKRTTTATKTSIRFDQVIAGDPSGYGYSYTKTVRLVPGKAQMVIEHVLKNTGTQPIETAVYSHNFLTLSADNAPGNENIAITAPFNITAEKPFTPGAAEVSGKTFRYLRAVKEGESVTSPISGFGTSVSDYDFKVTNTKTGFGQRIRADQPLARINFWSIRTNVSWEPYIAISLKPGETKRWTYTYDYFGPGEG